MELLISVWASSHCGSGSEREGGGFDREKAYCNNTCCHNDTGQDFPPSVRRREVLRQLAELVNHQTGDGVCQDLRQTASQTSHTSSEHRDTGQDVLLGLALVLKTRFYYSNIKHFNT